MMHECATEEDVGHRAADQGKSRRARLADRLAGRSETLILLSATPHDGSARSFASLMTLLDPTAISDPDDYTPGDYRHQGLVIRRFRKDIRHQVMGDFKERRTIKLTPQASEAQEAAYRALLAIRFTQAGIHRGGKQQELQRVAMQQAIFSSPFAALESNHTRLQLLTRASQPTADERQEVADLQAFAATLGAFCRRLNARLGTPKAMTATAHQRARLVYTMWKPGTAYGAPGMADAAQRDQERVLQP